ncbi:hypothetical protein EWM64_g8617 [Hericium alpestre]|uniref:Uncharacterized protein n=1 Tax=Hericium alpestre TaxID=135208 RepID=A0A4Y9ZN23_9AGAM|nr:hypothetical protein EWM64_g8617 [Hericium alpestre]
MFEFVMTDERISPGENNFRRAAAIRLMLQVYSEFTAAPVESLEFSCERYYWGNSHIPNIEVCGNTGPMLEDDMDSHSDMPGRVMRFEIIGDLSVRAACLQTILDTLQLSHVKRLYLSAPDPYFDIDWSQVLAKLQDLHTLIVEVGLADPLFETLGTAATERPNGQTDGVEREVYLPNLQRLRIEPRGMYWDIFELLAQALKTRMDWGSPVSLLHLDTCQNCFDADTKRALAEVVSSLVFGDDCDENDEDDSKNEEKDGVKENIGEDAV